MPSDLHMHTTYSDGKLTPEELVAKAKEAGLTYMAITDHDTVEGISHLYENGLYFSAMTWSAGSVASSSRPSVRLTSSREPMMTSAMLASSE